MRPKTIAIVAVTVDGKIARNDHELVRWTSPEDKEFFRSETKRIGALIVGKRTFDTFPGPLPGRMHIVMTRKTDGLPTNNPLVRFTDQTPERILEMLGTEGMQEVVIAGGSTIYTMFLKERLLDELVITVEPKIFGAGVSLFSESCEHSLVLRSQRMLNENSILLHYSIIYP
jgi:dihydrofolate reductase